MLQSTLRFEGSIQVRTWGDTQGTWPNPPVAGGAAFSAVQDTSTPSRIVLAPSKACRRGRAVHELSSSGFSARPAPPNPGHQARSPNSAGAMLKTSHGRAQVFLRPPSAADREEFIALTRRSRRFHTGWVAPPREAEAFGEYLRRNQRSDFEALLVLRSTDDAIVGAVNISQIFYGGFQSAYLGFWIGAAFARQGYMREALSQALKHGFGPLRLHRVEANVQPNNAPSSRRWRR